MVNHHSADPAPNDSYQRQLTSRMVAVINVLEYSRQVWGSSFDQVSKKDWKIWTKKCKRKILNYNAWLDQLRLGGQTFGLAKFFVDAQIKIQVLVPFFGQHNPR